MKLLITLDFFPECGGIQRYLYGIVKHTYATGDLVFVGCSKHPAHTESRDTLPVFVKYFTSIFSKGNKKASLFALTVPYLAACRKNRLALTVYCGNIYAALVPWLCSFVNKQPYIVYAYGTELVALRSRPLMRTVFSAVLNRAERIHVIGEYTSQLLDELKIATSRTLEVPRIEELKNVSERSGDTSLELPENQPCRIICVGRFVAHKGHEVLLSALAGIKQPNWELHLIGFGALEKQYRFLIKTLGIEHNVVIKTTCSDTELAAEYSQAHLFVLPSLQTDTGSEGFGIVLLEAMAHGVAIVASACGGIPEVLDNGAAGLLVPSGNVATLQIAIKKVLTDSVLRQSLVSHANLRLKENYVFE